MEGRGNPRIFRGFVTMTVGIIPSQSVYVTVFEYTRSLWDRQTPLAAFGVNFLGGGLASLAAASFAVPLDVISQRLMVQDGIVNKARYQGGIDAARKIFAAEGFPGFYRGFVASIAVVAPTSAIWWASYGAYTRKMSSLLPQFVMNYTSVFHALCGVAAGCTAAVLTNPLDVAKTRIQVLDTADSRRGNVFMSLKHLYQTEGVGCLTRGITARMTSHAPVSAVMIVAFEKVKEWSRI